MDGHSGTRVVRFRAAFRGRKAPFAPPAAATKKKKEKEEASRTEKSTFGFHGSPRVAPRSSCGLCPPKTKAPLRAPSFLVDTAGLGWCGLNPRSADPCTGKQEKVKLARSSGLHRGSSQSSALTKREAPPRGCFPFGGHSGTRTCDLSRVRRAL